MVRPPHADRLIVKHLGEGFHINWLPNANVHLAEVNADHWKTWVHQRLSTPISRPGAITFFQASPTEHLSFAKHLTAEVKMEEFISGKGMVTKWDRKRKQNHWFDALYNACAAGHYCGDLGVKQLLSASYFGAMVAEGFAETRTVSTKIIREVDNWDPLTTKVLMATWAAPYSAMPHSVPALDHRLEQGPHVALVLTRVNGYAAESERTYFTAPVSNEVRTAFAAMSEARRLAFDMIKPGLACSELDATVNAFLSKEGFRDEDQRLHRTGHGIGLGTHEAPWLAEGSEDRLSENMVISIEPGIYLKDVGGIRHSDTVLVTKDGHKQLTRFPQDLDSLILRGWKPTTRLKGFLVRRRLGLTGRRT